MSGEIPFFIEGKIAEISAVYFLAYVKVDNGNVYHIHPSTPGIEFQKLERGQIVELEVTSMLTRVLSARIL
jgi:hypothetical protein